MTDQELKDLVASLAVTQAETSQQLKENALQMKASEARMEARMDARMEALAQQAQKASAEFQAEMQSLAREIKQTEKQIKQTDKQLDALGNRLGGYTEGLIYPSMAHILIHRFGMETIAPRVRSARRDLELDILGYANGTLNTAYIVEIKSRADDEAVEQLLQILAEFPRAFPEHAGKKVYGILAAVDIPPNIRQRVVKLGMYLGQASEESFRLRVPAKFQPKNYGPG